VLREHGVEKGDRVAMLLPPTPETAAAFFATFKCGAILLSMSVLYGDEGIRHRVSDSAAKVLVWPTDLDDAVTNVELVAGFNPDAVRFAPARWIILRR
jgi:acyl-coenzyme A synthetase/AMP-(fatty) acid ligase